MMFTVLSIFFRYLQKVIQYSSFVSNWPKLLLWPTEVQHGITNIQCFLGFLAKQWQHMQNSWYQTQRSTLSSTKSSASLTAEYYLHQEKATAVLTSSLSLLLPPLLDFFFFDGRECWQVASSPFALRARGWLQGHTPQSVSESVSQLVSKQLLTYDHAKN